MMITSTNRKGKNAWEIPSLKTFNKHNDQEKKTLVKKKDLFYLHGIYSIQKIWLILPGKYIQVVTKRQIILYFHSCCNNKYTPYFLG
jgi:hypothetical protein